MRPFIAICAAVLAIAGTVPYAIEARAASDDAKDAGRAAENTLAIAVIGDSMARSYCRGLSHYARSLPSVDILCWTKPSTGLTRIDFYDWKEALTGKLQGKIPDAAVVSMGANDAQRMVYNKNVLEFAADDWTEVYSTRVGKFVETLSARGSRVFWVGMPIARSNRYSKRMSHLNQIYSANVKQRAQTFLPLWSLTQDKNGKFTKSMRDPKGRLRIARASDGIHFTGDGERIVACYIFRSVLPRLGVEDLPKGCRSKKK